MRGKGKSKFVCTGEKKGRPIGSRFLTQVGVIDFIWISLMEVVLDRVLTGVE